MNKLIPTGILLCASYVLRKDNSYICEHQGNFVLFYLSLLMSVVCFTNGFCGKYRLIYSIRQVCQLCKLLLTKLLLVSYPSFFTRDVAFLIVCHVCQQVFVDVLHIYQLYSFDVLVIPWYMIYNQTIIASDMESFYLGTLAGILLNWILQYLDTGFKIVIEMYS